MLDSRHRCPFSEAQVTPDCRVAVILAQNNLKYLIETDPVPNAVIPIWAIVGYAAPRPWSTAW